MTLELPPPLHVETVLGAVDAAGRRAAGRARDLGVAAVRSTMPARSGRARGAQRGRVTRTPVGYVITIAPSARVRYPNGVSAVEVTRFVEGGTGEQGPRHQTIPAGKRGRLPSGAVPTGRGQRPQHVYARVARSEEATAERLLIAGAQEAARDAEAVLARTL